MKLFALWRFTRAVIRAGRCAWKARRGEDQPFWREMAQFWIGSATSWARDIG